MDVLFAALNGVGKPAGLTVSRSRTIAFSQSQLPGQAMYHDEEAVKSSPPRSLDNKRLATRAFRFCVETRVNAGSDTPDQALDPYLSWAVQALCSNPQVVVNDVPLAHDVTEIGTKWESEENDAVYSAAKQFFLVEYVTSGSNPDQATAG
jgi:hypothetical protein